MAEIRRIDPSWKIKKDLVKDLPHIASVLSWPRKYYQKRITKIGFVGKDTCLLDAACGSGIWSIAASYHNKEIRAIDATKKYLSVAKEINLKYQRKNLQLKLGKLENLPYPDEYFNYVICYNAWMYTYRQKSLQEMYRVLKPGGKIYLGSIAGFGYYLMLIFQGFKAGNRVLVLTALRAIRDRVYMAEKESRYLLGKRGFKILSLDSDAQVGDSKIKVKPVFSAKFLGFWNIYEILAERI